MDTEPRDSQRQTSQSRTSSYLKTIATAVTWIELIIGLSAISSAVFLNRRVPILLYAFYGIYLGFFLWLLYSTCRSTYLQKGPLHYTYWICALSTLVTIAVAVLTFVTSPNAGEIAYISAIVFVVSLVLFPVFSAVYYCFLRGNFIMPKYMQGKLSQSQGRQDETSMNVTQETHDYRSAEV